MASGSSKDTFKALNNTFIASQLPDPLPDELLATIEAFLEQHQTIDEPDSQRLHEELLSIHKKFVAGTPEKDAAFLNILQRLRPAIRGDARLEEWWKLVIAPAINAVGHKREELEYAHEFLLGAMVFDPDEDPGGEKAGISSRFCDRLLAAYLARTKVPASQRDLISPVDEFIAHELETILVSFGRKMPRELLKALDTLFVQVEHRAQILGLLSAFVRTQPPHLYYVLDTPLLKNLLICLMMDTSITVIELALTVLIMLLPHITNSIKRYLPQVFLIYVRILCWDVVVDYSSNLEQEATPTSSFEGFLAQCVEDLSPEEPWARFRRSFGNTTKFGPPLVHYFTFMYGLFPLNFMGFIRKSRKWLKAHNFPRADEFEFNQDIIHNRTQEYQKVHLLHPNFYLTTPEDELNDNRYLNSDPADVVTDCMNLCVAVSSTLDDPGPPPSSELPELPKSDKIDANRASSTIVADEDPATIEKSSPAGSTGHKSSLGSIPSWRLEDEEYNSRKNSLHSLKKMPSRGSTIASPLLKPHEPTDSPTIPGRRKSSPQPPTERLPPIPDAPLPAQDTHTSEKLQTFAQSLSGGSIEPARLSAAHQSQSMASLHREVMLLRNDLNFERYLKHQHLVHIGQLQRKNLKEATAEAQTQNLINTNKTLKARLAKSDELNAQLKKETATSRAQSRKVEDQISAKLKALKEEQKTWATDNEALRLELRKLQQDCSKLKRIVDDSDARELRSQHQLRALNGDLAELKSLRVEVERLREALQSQPNGQDAQPSYIEQQQLRNDLEAAHLKLASRDAERERTRQAYERYIAELESRLHDGTSEPLADAGSLPPAAQQMIDAAIASSHSKLQHLKKAHSRLHDRYVELEMRCHELERERERAATQDLLTPHRSSASAGRTTPLLDRAMETSGPSLRRPGSRTSANHAPRLARSSNLPEDITSEEDDYYGEYPSRALSPVADQNTILRQSSPSTARPVRHESVQERRQPSLQQQQQQHVWQSSSTYGGASMASRDLGAVYEGTLDRSGSGQVVASGSSEPMTPSGKSTMSWDSNERKEKKEKIAPQSTVRVYGRGGAQNMGVKKKDKEKDKEKDKSKDKDKDKSHKSGGFRGLRGIM